jgi:hypothetical protein
MVPCNIDRRDNVEVQTAGVNVVSDLCILNIRRVGCQSDYVTICDYRLCFEQWETTQEPWQLSRSYCYGPHFNFKSGVE